MGLWRTLRALLAVYPADARRFVVRYTLATAMLTLLDTAALALLVVSLAPLVTGASIRIPLIGELPNAVAPWLILGVCLVFVVKNAAAVALFRHGTRRLAHYERDVADSIFRAYTQAPWDERSSLSSAELTRVADTSVSAATLSFVAQLIQVPGYALTCLAVLVVLFAAQPLNALVVLLYLGGFLVVLFRAVMRRTQAAGREVRTHSYRVGTIMTEMIDALRELTLRSKLEEVADEVAVERGRASDARGRLAFLATMPRYALEGALIGGIVIVGGISFVTSGGEAALISIGLFGAVALRLIPSLVMLQSSLGGARANQSYAEDVIRELQHTHREGPVRASDGAARRLPEKPRELTLKGVGYRYPRSEQDALTGVDLSVRMGSRLAIVGPSGSGKSTLVDLILGLRSPTAGKVSIDGIPLDDVLPQWRAHVGYVPQRVALFDASLAQNVALTWGGPLDEQRVLQALEKAQLTELITRQGGTDQPLGERGSTLSGGQQQRLGLARALYADPFVLVLDEATSALDTSTESLVMESLRSLDRGVTIIAIAHRLATIKDFDLVCYVEGGRVLGMGTFDDVQRQVPAFAAQVALAGLDGPLPGPSASPPRGG